MTTPYGHLLMECAQKLTWAREALKSVHFDGPSADTRTAWSASDAQMYRALEGDIQRLILALSSWQHYQWESGGRGERDATLTGADLTGVNAWETSSETT